MRRERDLTAGSLMRMLLKDRLRHIARIVSENPARLSRECEVMLLRSVPTCRLDVARRFRDLGIDCTVRVADVEYINQAVEADRQKSVIGLVVPAHDLNFIFMQVESRLALEIIQVPHSYARVFRAGG